jgi:hypothetical protein
VRADCIQLIAFKQISLPSPRGYLLSLAQPLSRLAKEIDGRPIPYTFEDEDVRSMASTNTLLDATRKTSKVSPIARIMRIAHLTKNG